MGRVRERKREREREKERCISKGEKMEDRK